MTAPVPSHASMPLADVERQLSTVKYLPCPDCDCDVVPSSGWSRQHQEATWCEDDQAECPECHRMVRANMTGDDDSEWMESCFVDELCPHGWGPKDCALCGES